MNNRKTKLRLTDFECKLLRGGMNEFRSMLLAEGITTEDVDELLIKLSDKRQVRSAVKIF